MLNLQRYRDEIEKLKKLKKTPGCVVFYGSSTFTMWENIADSFPHYAVLNYGFGGSTAEESLYFYDELMVDISPKCLVYYEGDNDIFLGYTNKKILEYFDMVFKKWCEEYNVPILVLPVKKSKSRENFLQNIEKFNLALKNYCKENQNIHFVDTAEMQKHTDIFQSDELHYNTKGYDILGKIINQNLQKWVKL